MAWTYSGDPATTPGDAVRFLVGDTNTARQELQDEEIAWLLTQEAANPLRAAARAAETLYGRYIGSSTTKHVGDMTISRTGLAQHYQALAARLWVTANSRLVAPFMPSSSRGLKHVYDQDRDRVDPFFTRDMWEYPNLGIFANNPEELLG